MRVIDQDEALRKEKLKDMRQETQEKTDTADYEMKLKYLEGDLQSITFNVRFLLPNMCRFFVVCPVFFRDGNVPFFKKCQFPYIKSRLDTTTKI